MAREITTRQRLSIGKDKLRDFITLGNLSTDVFEPRTSTGSWIFPSLERFDAIAFVMSNRKHKNKSFAVHGKEQNHAKKENIRLPVAVRGSKTSVLKFPIIMSETLKAVIASVCVLVLEFLEVEPGLDEEDVVDDFLPLFCVSDLFFIERRKAVRIEGYTENVVPNYNLSEFRTHFRLSVETFEQLHFFMVLLLSSLFLGCPLASFFLGILLEP